MDIALYSVNKNNWVDCISLKLDESQIGLVAPNVVSIAESKFNDHYILRAIYAGDSVVGFLMYCPEVGEENGSLYWLFRFMIDQSMQGQGIGRNALNLAISEMRDCGAKTINVIYSPRNLIAKKLYKRAGFIESGHLDDGDIVAQLLLHSDI